MMGHYQNNPDKGSKKSHKRGSTNNSSRLDAFAQRRGPGNADWGGCDCSRLQAVVVAITALGGAITLGLSRDLGAHSLTLMLDGQRETMWYNGDSDLDDELDAVIATLGATE